MAGIYFGAGQRLELVEQIVGLDSLALSAAHFHERAIGILSGNFVAHLRGAARSERDNVIGQVGERISFGGESERAQSMLHHHLRIGLARINHVVNTLGMAECGRVKIAGRIIGDPIHASAGVSVKVLVIKITRQQSELPQVIGDILADVGDCAVGADNNFGVRLAGIFRSRKFSSGDVEAILFRSALSICLRSRFAVGGRQHHPAAQVLAGAGQMDRAALLQQCEGNIPKV